MDTQDEADEAVESKLQAVFQRAWDTRDEALFSRCLRFLLLYDLIGTTYAFAMQELGRMFPDGAATKEKSK